jgi:Short C-terminal domain
MPLRRGPGLVRTVGRTAVIAGTASAVGGRVQHRQQEKYAAQDQPQQVQYVEAPPAAPAAPSADDQMEQLEKLGDLHAKGILTDEEFAAKKAQILGI